MVLGHRREGGRRRRRRGELGFIGFRLEQKDRLLFSLVSESS